MTIDVPRYRTDLVISLHAHIKLIKDRLQEQV